MAALNHGSKKALELNNSLQIIANNTAGTNQLGTTPYTTYKEGSDGSLIPAVTDDSTKGTAGTGTEKQLTIPGMEGLDLAARRGLTIAHGVGDQRGDSTNPGVVQIPNGQYIVETENGEWVPATEDQIKDQWDWYKHMETPWYMPHGNGENTSNNQRSLQIA